MSPRPPVQSHRQTLPFHEPAFGWDTFEDFFCDFLNAQPEIVLNEAGIEIRQRVIRARPFGRKGDSQYGIDILAEMEGGEVWEFQCKHYKEWGPADTRETILAYNRNAPRRFLLVTREVSEACQEVISGHPGWHLWDAREINRRFRELNSAKAAQILFTHFGRGWGEAFFGISGDISFIGADAKFESYLKEGPRFPHRYPLAPSVESLQPLIEPRIERPDTAKAISKRLRDSLDYLFTWGDKDHYQMGKGISMAQIAREIGCHNASKLEAVYRGDAPLSFEDGDKICKMFGMYITWLEEGKGTPFLQTPLFGDSLEALRDFYEKGVHYTSLCFALSDEIRGEALVYGELSPFRYELLLSDLPIHDNVGGGASGLLNFCYFLAMFCYLKDAKTNIMSRAFGDSIPRMVGVVLDPEKYRSLTDGNIHPGEIFDKPVIQHSEWFEDLADIDLPKCYLSDPGVRHAENWQRAFDFITNDLKLQNICSNCDLIKFVYNHYLKPLRPMDFQIASMLKENNEGGENHALEHYEDIVEKAKNSENSEERKQVWSLFNENRMALPEWLDYIYIEGIDSLATKSNS